MPGYLVDQTLNAARSVAVLPAGQVSSTNVQSAIEELDTEKLSVSASAVIDSKAPSASPTFTGLVTLPANTVIGDISSTELSYMDGASANIQNQLNTKSPTVSPIFTGTPQINGVNQTTPAKFEMSSVGDDTSFYYKELFKITGLTSATEITRMSATGSNGLNVYFKIIAVGHTAAIGNGINIKEFVWAAGTSAPTQISTITNGSVPPITFNNATNNVCIINLASSNGTSEFRGTVLVEWIFPGDFSNNTATIF